MKHALLAVPLAALTLALSSSAPAQADPIDDQQFYELLQHNGINPGPNAVGVAHQVCAWVWKGVDPEAVSRQVSDDNPMDLAMSRRFVASAIVAYCLPTQSNLPVFVA